MRPGHVGVREAAGHINPEIVLEEGRRLGSVRWVQWRQECSGLCGRAVMLSRCSRIEGMTSSRVAEATGAKGGRQLRTVGRGQEHALVVRDVGAEQEGHVERHRRRGRALRPFVQHLVQPVYKSREDSPRLCGKKETKTYSTVAMGRRRWPLGISKRDQGSTSWESQGLSMARMRSQLRRHKVLMRTRARRKGKEN